MTTIELTGQISEDGELRAKVPDNIKPGEVRIIVELPDSPREEEVAQWTEDELDDLLKIEPSTNEEILAMLNSQDYISELQESSWRNISDGAAWVEQQRRKRREHHLW